MKKLLLGLLLLALPTQAAIQKVPNIMLNDVATTASNGPYGLKNISVKYAIASSALTATITQADGSTVPTVASPSIYFTRGTTATVGAYVANSITTTNTVVVSSGTTLGVPSSIPTVIYIYGATSGVVLASSAYYDENSLQSYVAETFSTSCTQASPSVCTSTAHGLNNGDAIRLAGTISGGLTTATTYYVVSSAANTFQLSATYGGTAINKTSGGTQTPTVSIAGTRLVASTGVAPAANVGIKLLVRMTFNITSGTWAAPSEVSSMSVPYGGAVFVIVTGNPQASYSANTAIKWPTVARDSESGYNPTTGGYTTKHTGLYHVHIFSDTNSSGIVHYVTVDGVTQAPAMFYVTGSGLTGGDTAVFAYAGQVIDVRATGTWSVVAGTDSGLVIYQIK